MNERPFRAKAHSRRALLRSAGAGLLALTPMIADCVSAGRKGKSSGSPVESAPVRGGTLTLRSFADVSNLDYARPPDLYSQAVIVQCVEQLLRQDAGSNISGMLAESWENPDSLTYVFRLRQGVRFQDGTTLDAHAVDYSLRRKIANGGTLGGANFFNVDTIETPASNTVRITLVGPFAPFLADVAAPAGSVISPATAERYGPDRLNRDLSDVGTGPFRFTGWRSSDGGDLVRNPDYWGKDGAGNALPYLDKTAIRIIPDENVALESLRVGEIDGFEPSPVAGPPPKDTTSIQRDPSLMYATMASSGCTALLLNGATKPFTDKTLRQAVSCAVDRAAIAKTVFFDQVTPLDVVFASSSFAYDPDYHPYLKQDLGRAKTLLAQSGRQGGFAFTLLIRSASPTSQATAELIQDQLKQAGITMTIQALDFPSLLAAVEAGHHQAALLGVFDNPDPDWISKYFVAGGVFNAVSHYSNPEVERLLTQARSMVPVAQRAPLYRQAQRLIFDDAAWCALYNPLVRSLTSRRIHGLPLTPTGLATEAMVWKGGSD